MGPKSAFWLESDNQKACEIARIAGYELIIFDMEHGVLDTGALDRLVPLCSEIGLETYVRVSEATQPCIQTALDIGAAGVILPQIKNLDHARSATAYSKFPPLGIRGIGYSRIQSYGAASDAFIAAENQDRQCYVMIETSGAFDDVAEIAALDSVDGLFIGPGDLSLARGRGIFAARPGDTDDMKRIAAVAAEKGKPWAAAAGDPRYWKVAAALDPAFLTSADELSAMLIGFRQLMHMPDSD
ncbi:MAG: aldolase/citrate lyase family protein [Alphaproteobacteria bacterium]|nr:aldolase/citrate lyase family protein [Alphaproteobacteria bacterium]